MRQNRTLALRSAIALAVLAAIGPASFGSGQAVADEMKFRYTNPSFGGNPFNSAHLLGVANAQNDYEKPKSSVQQTQADQFVRLLQSRLLSGLAGQVSEAILGENAQPSGRVVYGGQTVTWETGLDAINLTITDASGATSVIEIPTVDPAS